MGLSQGRRWMRDVVERYKRERDEAVARRDEAEVEAAEHQAEKERVLGRLEMFQKYVYIKTGLFQLHSADPEFGKNIIGAL